MNQQQKRIVTGWGLLVAVVAITTAIVGNLASPALWFAWAVTAALGIATLVAYRKAGQS